MLRAARPELRIRGAASSRERAGFGAPPAGVPRSKLAIPARGLSLAICTMVARSRARGFPGAAREPGERAQILERAVERVEVNRAIDAVEPPVVVELPEQPAAAAEP